MLFQSGIPTHQKRSMMFVLVAVFFCLHSCKVFKVNDDKDSVVVSDSFPQALEESIDFQKQANKIQVGWIAALNDPALIEWVSDAQKNNESPQVTIVNIERARVLARQAGVHATSILFDDLSDSKSRFSVGLKARWEFDIWSAVQSDEAEASNNHQLNEKSHTYFQHSLAAGVASAYFSLMEVEQQYALVQKVIRTLLKTRRLAESKRDNDLIEQEYVELINADLTRAKSSLIEVSKNKRDAIEVLKLLLGDRFGADRKIEKQFPIIPLRPESSLPSHLLERRPDIIAADKNIAILMRGAHLAERVASLPRFLLNEISEGPSSDLVNITNLDNTSWQEASAIVKPFVRDGSRKVRLRTRPNVSGSKFKAAVASYVQTALSAFREIEMVLDGIEILEHRNKQLDVISQQLSKTLDTAWLRYNQGEIDLINVLSVQQQFFTAQGRAIAIDRLRLEQYIDLNLVLGGDWNVETESIH